MCIQELPEIVKTYIPAISQELNDIFTFLKYEKKVNYTKLFISSVSSNRKLYLKFKDDIDGFISYWLTSSQLPKVRKLMLLRYFTHSFGIIFYYPQSFLTKKMKKEEFVKEFSFFTVDGTKSILCDEHLLKKALSHTAF